MKKILLGTTAIIALSTFSAEAFAAEKIKLGLGGFMRHYVGISNHDEVAVTALAGTTRALKLQQNSNTEVYFRGSTTLDNGLSVSVDIQRESDKSTAGRNDVSALTVSSDTMGALTIGSAGHAGDDMIVRVPNAGNFDWGDTDTYGAIATTTGANSAAFAMASASDITDMGGKDGKLKYISPSFSGVTVYASYSAGEGSGASNLTSGSVNRNTAIDGSTFGVAYSGEVGGAAVSADVTQFRSNGVKNTNHFGLNVGMAGVTIGGGYSAMNDDSGVQSATVASLDGKAWELGVAFETGPYTMSAGYMKAESKGTTTAGNHEDTKWNLAATYDMGAGVALTADYFRSKSDAEGTAVAATDGTVSGVIAGIEVGF